MAFQLGCQFFSGQSVGPFDLWSDLEGSLFWAIRAGCSLAHRIKFLHPVLEGINDSLIVVRGDFISSGFARESARLPGRWPARVSRGSRERICPLEKKVLKAVILIPLAGRDLTIMTGLGRIENIQKAHYGDCKCNVFEEL